MRYVIGLNTAQYAGLLERLNEMNRVRPEIFLEKDLIPAVQNAKIYEENIEKSLPYCEQDKLKGKLFTLLLQQIGVENASIKFIQWNFLRQDCS